MELEHENIRRRTKINEIIEDGSSQNEKVRTARTRRKDATRTYAKKPRVLKTRKEPY